MPIVRADRNSPAVQTIREGTARHPLLAIGSDHFYIYHFVRQNPGVRTSEIVRACQTRHQRISELKNEGLLRPGPRKKRETTWFVCPENETGNARDRLAVRLRVYVNELGFYSVDAELLGQHDDALKGRLTEVMLKDVVVFVPRPSERVVSGEDGLTPTGTDAGNKGEDGPVIEGEFVISS